jgi:hypothetical protein
LNDFVINKSWCPFTEEEMNVLNRGLNFTIRLKVPALVDCLSCNVKLDVRNGIKKIVKHATYRNNIVTEIHREQVVKILREKNCYYTKPEKSYAVVIMDKEKYVEGMQQLIDYWRTI